MTIKTDNIQVGLDLVANNNFTLSVSSGSMLISAGTPDNPNTAQFKVSNTAVQIGILQSTSNVITLSTGHKLVGTDHASIYSPGTVVQIRTANSGPTKQTISSSSPVAIDGLSINFTPKLPNSVLVFDAMISTNAPHVTSFGFYRDNAPTVSTSSNNNENNMQSTLYQSITETTDAMYAWPLKYYESVAGNLSARTYTVVGTASWGGTNRSLQINNRNSNDMAAFSYFTIMEIAQ